MLSFLRENYQLICLIVAILGVLIGILSLLDELRKRKKTTGETPAKKVVTYHHIGQKHRPIPIKCRLICNPPLRNNHIFGNMSSLTMWPENDCHFWNEPVKQPVKLRHRTSTTP